MPLSTDRMHGYLALPWHLGVTLPHRDKAFDISAKPMWGRPPSEGQCSESSANARVFVPWRRIRLLAAETYVGPRSRGQASR